MRTLLLISCGLALSACTSSDLFAPYTVGQGQSYHQGQYQTQHNTQHHTAHKAVAQQGYAYPGHQGAYGAPVTVNAAGQGYHAAHHGGAHPAYGQGQGYGVPALRGASQPQVYGNLGLIKYDVDEKPLGIVGRVGVQQGYFGAEVEATTGITNQDDIDTDYSIGAFGVVRAPITPQLNVLGRAGYNKANINNFVHVDDFAYGVGAEYNFDAQNGVRLDYTRYELEDFGNADSVSATFVRRF